MSLQTAERISSFDKSDNVIFQRHLVAYNEAARLIAPNLNIVEIGCGEGYGFTVLAPQAHIYEAIDKFGNPETNEYIKQYPQVHFQQASVPPFPFPDNTFDALVTFQVIEHIEPDEYFMREAHRILKPGGIMVLTTPNIKMSITRNPWHIREYTVQELQALAQKYFANVDMKGVYGNQKVMDYYQKNKEAVKKFTQFDIFNLQYKLPRPILQIPYDILNRLNRRLLLKKNNELVTDIQLSDYFVDAANDQCFDLLVVAKK